MLTTERADRRQARHEREVAAYHDPQTKFERRAFLAAVDERQPGLSSAEREELWQACLAAENRRREMTMAAFEHLWEEQDAAAVPASRTTTPASTCGTGV